MEIINVNKAKKHLTKYIDLIESKQISSVLISRNGKPIAELIPFEEKRIGIAKGMWRDVSDDEFDNFDMCSLFTRGIDN